MSTRSGRRRLNASRPATPSVATSTWNPAASSGSFACSMLRARSREGVSYNSTSEDPWQPESRPFRPFPRPDSVEPRAVFHSDDPQRVPLEHRFRVSRFQRARGRTALAFDGAEWTVPGRRLFGGAVPICGPLDPEACVFQRGPRGSPRGRSPGWHRRMRPHPSGRRGLGPRVDPWSSDSYRTPEPDQCWRRIRLGAADPKDPPRRGRLLAWIRIQPGGPWKNCYVESGGPGPRTVDPAVRWVSFVQEVRVARRARRFAVNCGADRECDSTVRAGRKPCHRQKALRPGEVPDTFDTRRGRDPPGQERVANGIGSRRASRTAVFAPGSGECSSTSWWHALEADNVTAGSSLLARLEAGSRRRIRRRRRPSSEPGSLEQDDEGEEARPVFLIREWSRCPA